jgi:hypothetical protein
MRGLRRPARQLRATIDEMPLETRRAMLDALDREPKRPARPGAPRRHSTIIVGAYASRDGGVCPMLAAHRNGGRTDYAPFARAWDRYARAGRSPRPASEGELRTLRAMLGESIAGEDVRGPGALARAIADHRRSLYARARREEHDVEPYDLDPPATPRQEPAYSPSPGRTNCSSGTMQAGEVLSR